MESDTISLKDYVWLVFISVIGSKVHVLLWYLYLLSYTGAQHYTYHVFSFYFTIVISVTFSAHKKKFSVHSCLQLFVRGNMSYLRYLCLFVHSGIQHILFGSVFGSSLSQMFDLFVYVFHCV